MDVGQSVARGLATLVASRGVVFGLQFVTLALLAHHLEPAGLGVYTFAVAIAAMFRILPNFGLIPVLTREIAQAPEREPALLPNVIYMRLALGVAAYGLLAASLPVVGFDGDQREAALIAGLVLLLAIDSFRSAVEVRMRMAWISLADTVEAAATVLGTLLLVRADAGVVPFLWLYVGLKFGNAIIVTFGALRMGRFEWHPRGELWAPLLKAAIPLGLAGVMMALYYRLDGVMLALLKPPEDVGQYGVGYRFLEAFAVLPAIVLSVLAPVLSRSVVEGRAVLERRYGHTLHLSAVLGIPVAVVGAATAWRVLPELPGFERYSGAGVALSVLAPAASLILVGTVVQGTLIASHLQRRLLAIAAQGLAVNVVLNVALIPPYSYVGAAIATTATEIVLVALSLRDARRHMGLRWPRGRFAGLASATTLLCVVLIPGFWLHPFAQVVLAVLAYLVALPALGVLTRADVRPLAPTGAEDVTVTAAPDRPRPSPR